MNQTYTGIDIKIGLCGSSKVTYLESIAGARHWLSRRFSAGHTSSGSIFSRNKDKFCSLAMSGYTPRAISVTWRCR